MGRDEIVEHAQRSGLDLNLTEVEYIYHSLQYDMYALDTSMSISVAQNRAEAHDKLLSDRTSLLDQFIEWLWRGEPCKTCEGHGYFFDMRSTYCETCDGAGRLYTQIFSGW